MIYRVTGDHQENNENNGRLFSLASPLPWLIPAPRHGAELQWGAGQPECPALACHGQGSGTALQPAAPWAGGTRSIPGFPLLCSRHTHTAALNYSRNKPTLPLRSNTEESFNHILQVLGHKVFFVHRTCWPKMIFKVIIIHRWGVRFVNVFMREKTTQRPSSPIKWKLLSSIFQTKLFICKWAEDFEIKQIKKPKL